MTEDELERYARHIILREVGGPGQARLRRARAAVIGAGGLGAPVLQYLAAAGVGRLVIIDDDVVSLSNLQRQVIFRSADVGAPKARAAADAIARLNPGVEAVPRETRLTAENADDLLGGADIVVDGSDNFETRRLANAAAARLGVPLVFGALGQWEGQVSLFDVAAGGPCYACLFPEDPAPGLAPSCAEAGVVGALAGWVGSIMALEAVKRLVGAGATLTGRLMLIDALAGETRVLRYKRRADCPIAGKRANER